MEQTTIRLTHLRKTMERAGISQVELADASGVAQPHISAILLGREYCSPARASRLQAALRALALEKSAEHAAREDLPSAQAQPPAEPRVRQL